METEISQLLRRLFSLGLPQGLTDNVKDGGSRKQIQDAFNAVNGGDDIELKHFLAKYRGLAFQYGINTNGSSIC